MTELLTRAQLAEAMGISQGSVYRLVLRGMPSVRVGPRGRRFGLMECVAWAVGLDLEPRGPASPYIDWEDDERDYACVLISDPCCYCGGRPATQVDHIQPRVHGGPHVWANFTGACATCNNSKRAKSLLSFLLERDRPRNHRGRPIPGPVSPHARRA